MAALEIPSLMGVRSYSYPLFETRLWVPRNSSLLLLIAEESKMLLVARLMVWEACGSVIGLDEGRTNPLAVFFSLECNSQNGSPRGVGICLLKCLGCWSIVIPSTCLTWIHTQVNRPFPVHFFSKRGWKFLNFSSGLNQTHNLWTFPQFPQDSIL